MKMLITVLAALAFSMSMLAQYTSQPSQSQSDQSAQSQSSQSQTGQSGQATQGTTGSAASNAGQGQRMSGKVSSNGKSFTDDATGKSYTVSNPDALQNYQNQHVVVLVHADPDTGSMTITAVQPPQ